MISSLLLVLVIVHTIVLLLPLFIFGALPHQKSALGVLQGKVNPGGTSFVQRRREDGLYLRCTPASCTWRNPSEEISEVAPTFRVAIPSGSPHWLAAHRLNIPKYRIDQHISSDLFSDVEQATGFMLTMPTFPTCHQTEIKTVFEVRLIAHS